MASATYQQTNFLAGEWSPLSQGRSDHPKYRSAMNLSLNGYPVEEGAWVRRPGFRLCAPTFKGQAAKLYAVHFTGSAPYDVEFTDGNIRFFNGPFPVITAELPAVANISTADPSVITFLDPLTWATDDEIVLVFDPAMQSGEEAHMLRQRTFLITAIPETYAAYNAATTYGIGSLVASVGINYVSIQTPNLNKTPAANPAYWTALDAAATRTFSIRDAITDVDVDGATIDINTFLGVFALRALRLATPYTLGTWENARIVQNQHVAVVVNGTHIPQALQITPNLGSSQAAEASIKDVYFQDGPYLDPVKNSIVSLSGLSGIVTATVNFAAYDAAKTYDIGEHVKSGASAYRSLVGGNIGNDPATNPTEWIAVDNGVAVTGPGHPVVTGFQSTDVGRLMRFYSQPAEYVLASTHTAGNIVTYNGLVYEARENNASIVPDSDILIWKPLPTGAIWTWGKITAVTNTNTATVQILGDALLYNLDIRLWRLGVYSDTSGWPTCGVFTEGRLMLSGALPNRFDTTKTFGVTPDGVADFAPTDKYGNVLDSSGISYTLEGEDQNTIYWLSLDQNGVAAGTKGGEWLIRPSTLNEAMTARNIKAVRVTKYKSADIEPKRTGISLVFIQAFGRRVLEFLADVFTGRYVAPNLTELAKHHTQEGLVEMTYQEELTPILWFRTALGKLKGATYRRKSSTVAEAPEFIGWHQHTLGHAREIESMTVGPNSDGTLDALAVVTNDATLAAADQVRWVEQMTLMFDVNDSLYDAWFLDGGAVPDNMYEDTVVQLPTAVTGQRLTGLWYLIGKTLTVFIAGLDVGDFTVDENGTIFVPYGSGVAPAVFDYTAPGAGAYLFTADLVAYIKSLNLHSKNGGISLAGRTITITTVITTNPNGTSKIQDLQPAEVVRSDMLVADWATGKLLLITNAFAGTSVMNMLSGVEIVTRTIDSTMGEVGDNWNNGAGDVDSAGIAYLSVSSLTDSVLKEDTATLTKILSGGGTGDTDFPPARSLVVIEANSKYIVGMSNTPVNGIAKASDLTLIGGGINAGGDPSLLGWNQTSWAMESSGGAIAAGAATHKNNVASAYVIQNATAWPAAIAYYFIGVADGIPTPESDSPETSGKKGKGKAKKGAQDASHTPSVATPQVYFAKIGNLVPSDIDANFTEFLGWDGIVINEQDNSTINSVTMATTGIAAWSATTVYHFVATLYAVWVAGSYALADYVRGTVLTNNTAILYQANKVTIVDPETVGQVDWDVAGISYLAYDNAQAYVTGDYVLSAGTLYKASQATTGNAPPNATYWDVVTTVTSSCATKGLGHGNRAKVWVTKGGINTLGTVDPETDTAGTSFPQTGTYWDQVPRDYIISMTTGQYSRINTGSFGLKWKVPIDEPMAFGNGMAQGRVKGGLFGYISWFLDSDGLTSVWLIDTSTGEYFVGTIPGLTFTADHVQAWDDQSQSFICYARYTSTVPGAPIALNATATFVDHWCRLYVGDLTISNVITSTRTTQPNGYTYLYVDTDGANFPCIVGSTYTSRGQTLRAIEERQSGAKLGPAFGKTRRSHKYAALFHNTMGVSVGTDFTAQGLLPALFKNNDTNALYDPQTMFSGIWKDALEGGYDFDSLLSWQISRPYPASVVSIGAFLKTQDE